VLVDQLGFRRYMARKYDPDAPPPDLDPSVPSSIAVQINKALMRSGRQTEKSVLDSRKVMWDAVAPELSLEERLGDLDGYLRAESARWRDKADSLEKELGHRFLNADRARQAAMVRDWIRNYRQQGRLPIRKQRDDQGE
jgi:hypothetical protein